MVKPLVIVFAALALASGLASIGGSSAPGVWLLGFAVSLFALVLALIRLIGSHAAASVLRSQRPRRRSESRVRHQAVTKR